MSAPWKSDQTTLEKIEGTVMDFLDGLDIEDRVNDVKEKIPGVEPTRKSHKKRNILLLAVIGAIAAAFVAARNKPQPPAAPPPAYTPAT